MIYIIKSDVCGHTIKADLIGKGADRERQLDYMSRNICKECRQKEYDAKQQANIDKSVDYVALNGSQKQIDWAVSIRIKVVEMLDSLINAFTQRLERQELIDAVVCYRDYITSKQTDSTFFIDRRDQQDAWWVLAAKAHYQKAKVA